MVTTLWELHDMGIELIAASVRWRSAGLWHDELLPVHDESIKASALRRWREGLLAWIGRTSKLEDPLLLAEIGHYETISLDDSVQAAWRERAFPFGWGDCESMSKKDKCDNCCTEEGDKRRRWGCDVLVGPLAGIGSCLLAGGAANPLGCTAAGAFGGAALNALCKEAVDEREAQCHFVCDGKKGGENKFDLTW